MADSRALAPTKSNLMKVKDQLAFAKQGYSLLDQKRNILVVELMNLVDEATEFEEKADSSLALAYQALQKSVMSQGRLKTGALALAVNVESSIVTGIRKVMGVELPVIDTKFEDRPPYYSPIGASSYIDEAVVDFRDALRLMGRLAELKISIMRLADEVKKTIRKVNALEKVAIPEAQAAIAVIQNRLEENERDMFVLMKSVKKNLESKGG